MGRPRIYSSETEKMRAYRESKRQGGAIRLDCYVPSEYRELLTQLCNDTHQTLGGLICYLVDCYMENRDDNS